MSIPAPHFLLFSESRRHAAGSAPSHWRFVLQSLDGKSRLEAADAEPALGCERLELLAVVRGLEALEQPSNVTLVTPSKYVARGLSYGLNDWRENDWNWENHGQMVPIKNRDLWQRLDRALAYHRVKCRATTSDEPDEPQQVAASARRDHALKPSILRSDLGVAASPRAVAAQGGGQGLPAGIRASLAALLLRLAARLRGMKQWLSEIESPTGRWRIS